MAITQEGVRRLAAIRDDWVQGFALAATSHDIGTAQAFFA
jgi:putative effector of murein hydrolase